MPSLITLTQPFLRLSNRNASLASRISLAMTTKSSSIDEPNVYHTREVSPFFSLPNEDGSNAHDSDQSQQQQQCLPVTLSCAHCERIVGDSSAFLFATRQMRTITLDRMVSVAIGIGGLKTSLEGQWDEFCNYKDITCGKCTTALGKMYYATTSKLSALQKKYTVHLTALSFYHHTSNIPSLPIAATSEIYAQLHPSPEALAENIDHIMTICVMLRDEQGDIIRELKRLGAVTGFDVDLEDGGTSVDGSDAKDDWKEKVQALDGLLKKVKSLEAAVERMRSENGGRTKDGEPMIQLVSEEGEEVALGEHKGEGKLKVSKESRGKRQSGDLVSGDIPQQQPQAPRRQEKKTPQASLPHLSTGVNKRKRKPNGEYATAADKQTHITSNTTEENLEPQPQPQPQRKSKEVPNSQSADEEEVSVEALRLPYKAGVKGNQEYEVIETLEDEEIENQIKSPSEKRRRSVTVSIIPKKEAVGRRVSQGRKGHK